MIKKLSLILICLFLGTAAFGECTKLAHDAITSSLSDSAQHISSLHYFDEINVNTSDFISEADLRNILDNGWEFLMIATVSDEDSILSKKIFTTKVFPFVGEDGELTCD